MRNSRFSVVLHTVIVCVGVYALSHQSNFDLKPAVVPVAIAVFAIVTSIESIKLAYALVNLYGRPALRAIPIWRWLSATDVMSKFVFLYFLFFIDIGNWRGAVLEIFATSIGIAWVLQVNSIENARLKTTIPNEVVA